MKSNVKTRTNREKSWNDRPLAQEEVSRKRVEIELRCEASGAKSVFAVGDFNDWRVGETRMAPGEGGLWRAQLCLEPGRYEYRFVVDGEWRDDPHASTLIPNEFGSNNCVLQVQWTRRCKRRNNG